VYQLLFDQYNSGTMIMKYYNGFFTIVLEADEWFVIRLPLPLETPTGLIPDIWSIIISYAFPDIVLEIPSKPTIDQDRVLYMQGGLLHVWKDGLTGTANVGDTNVVGLDGQGRIVATNR